MGYARRVGVGSDPLPGGWIEVPPANVVNTAPQFKPKSWYYVIAYGQYVPEFPGAWMLGRQICSEDHALIAYSDSCVAAESAACLAYNQVDPADKRCAVESLWVRLYVYGADEKKWTWTNVNSCDEASIHSTGAGCDLCGNPRPDEDGVLVNDCPSSSYLAGRAVAKTYGGGEEGFDWGNWSYSSGTNYCYPACGKNDPLLRDVPPPPIGRPTPTKEMLKQMAAERDKLKSLPKPSGGTAPDTSGPSKVPWVAIGIGAAAVGGLGLLWWAGRKS